MMIRTVLFYLTIVLCVGCALDNKRNDMTAKKIIRLDLSRDSKDVFKTGLIDDVQIISLKSEDALLGDIRKVLKYGDRIYLTDLDRTQSVFVYDTLGHFINLISKVGKGPEEYIQLEDIFVNSDDSTLNLVSRIDKKIHVYDLDGKRLLNVLKTPKSFMQFSKSKDGFVGYMANWAEDQDMAKNVWMLSRDLKFVSSFFEIDPSWESYSNASVSVFSNYKDSTFYIQPFDYNVYSLSKKGYIPIYTFDFGAAAWPLDLNTIEKMDRISPIERSRYVQSFNSCQETGRFLLAQILYNGQNLLCVHDKQTNAAFTAKLEHYTDKYFFPFGKIVGMDETAIYSLIDAYTMKRMADGKDEHNDFESKYPDQVKRLRAKIGNVQEDGNPFLVIYHLN
ncbi:6-bladed beta-propeller [Arcticibacter tournemirensis]|uniref:6-bladed beta-propeller n=1 Tax=Arcticibacter tournemirensis TaxID=699437 RepID=A0A4Q0MEH1_9SPHI|nr:6-bladed beta-propeller [Arcticibacter tournemirensis]RXF71827.1 6-bladed beta-propeller [Arcticibacter tournemirensis]